MSIHSTAIVATSAQIPASCTVGPYCTIGPNVVLGEDCELVSHVVLDGHLIIGRNNRVFSFACLGIAPQDASPEHWQHVHNQLTAGEAPRPYAMPQHRAWLLRRRVQA